MKMLNDELTAQAEVDSLPGCSQVAVIHSAFVVPHMRRRGVGERAHQKRLTDLKENFLYDAAICTVCSENEAEIKILERNGWECVGNFLSRKTQHEVLIYLNTFTRELKTKTYEDYLEEMEAKSR